MKGEVRDDRQLMKVEETAIEQLNLEDSQLAEQLYNSAGLDPVVDAGLGDYDKRIERENKLINKVLGPRGVDIRGYGESVAKRVAFAIYSVLNKQYGGKVGDMRSYIMTLEDERNRANDKFDELNGKGFVLGVNEKYSYQQYTYENWSEGQTILIGTDGIWETVNPEGEKFGKERIKEILRENNEFSALQIIDTITEELSAFRKEAVQDDDITMVIITSILHQLDLEK